MPEELTILFPRTIETHQDYILAVTILQWWSICYYQCCYEAENMPEVPDDINDVLYDKVETWEKSNPDKINPWSTTQHGDYVALVDDERKAHIRHLYVQIQKGLLRLEQEQC
jgi:NAD-dependent DNA ligase